MDLDIVRAIALLIAPVAGVFIYRIRTKIDPNAQDVTPVQPKTPFERPSMVRPLIISIIGFAAAFVFLIASTTVQAFKVTHRYELSSRKANIHTPIDGSQTGALEISGFNM